MAKREMWVLTWARPDTRRPTPEQDAELRAWQEAEGIPGQKVYALRFDPAARSVTVYRYAHRAFPELGMGPCVFVGYLTPDGRAVLDKEWGEAAKEWPTTHEYVSDPPPWLADVAYKVERDVVAPA